jgi:hypothetical protein
VHRVRQSRIYQTASLIIIMWGVLVFAGYIANYTWPPQGHTIWAVVDLIGIAGSIAIAAFSGVGPGAGAFALRLLVAFLRDVSRRKAAEERAAVREAMVATGLEPTS